MSGSIQILSEISISFFFQVSKRDESEREAVYAEADPVWRVRITFKYVSKVGVPCSAPNLCPSHPKRIIRQIYYDVGVYGF